MLTPPVMKKLATKNMHMHIAMFVDAPVMCIHIYI